MSYYYDDDYDYLGQLELLAQGVKPWDDDAGMVLSFLRGNYFPRGGSSTMRGSTFKHNDGAASSRKRSIGAAFGRQPSTSHKAPKVHAAQPPRHPWKYNGFKQDLGNAAYVADLQSRIYAGSGFFRHRLTPAKSPHVIDVKGLTLQQVAQVDAAGNRREAAQVALSLQKRAPSSSSGTVIIPFDDGSRFAPPACSCPSCTQARHAGPALNRPAAPPAPPMPPEVVARLDRAMPDRASYLEAYNRNPAAFPPGFMRGLYASSHAPSYNPLAVGGQTPGAAGTGTGAGGRTPVVSYDAVIAGTASPPYAPASPPYPALDYSRGAVGGTTPPFAYGGSSTPPMAIPPGPGDTAQEEAGYRTPVRRAVQGGTPTSRFHTPAGLLGVPPSQSGGPDGRQDPGLEG